MITNIYLSVLKYSEEMNQLDEYDSNDEPIKWILKKRWWLKKNNESITE